MEFLAVPALFPSTCCSPALCRCLGRTAASVLAVLLRGKQHFGDRQGDRWQPVPPATFPVGVLSPVVSDPEEPS